MTGMTASSKTTARRAGAPIVAVGEHLPVHAVGDHLGVVLTGGHTKTISKTLSTMIKMVVLMVISVPRM